jgi:hypothetical protein
MYTILARSLEWQHMFQETSLIVQLPDLHNNLEERRDFTVVRISERGVD